MGLKELKFNGFKSFADSTSIKFLNNLNAVVGPNGCGKSNIVDGVRWVIGETSSKQLRGQSMSDVIFNGTEHRKQMGLAMAELVFDNSDGMLGGEYAKYNEILIRREVTRDGTSDYFINNTRCRRKDIIDIFLGTGLGSANYAIIEQGMITNVIDAKAGDLRSIIEETAGISKYKERRRATESRMRQTKENLARLNDIRVEIESQLKVLKKQSNAAEYYQKLRKDERNFKAKISAWQWQTLTDEITKHNDRIDREELSLNAKIADQRGYESTLEKLKQQSIEAEDGFNNIQNNFYKLNSTIAQLEQQIHYNKSRVTELTEEQEKIEREYQEISAQQTTDNAQKELLQSEIDKLTQQREGALETLNGAQQELQEQQQVYTKWQAEWEDFSKQYADLLTQVEVGDTKLHYLQQNRENVQRKIENLQNEQQEIDLTILSSEITTLSTQQQQITTELQSKQEKFKTNQEEIVSLRSSINSARSELDKLKQQQQLLLNKDASLKSLQKAAFGDDGEHIENWLKDKDLHNNRRLLKELKIDPAWENALETVLNVYLDAVCIEDMQAVIPHLENHDVPHNLAFISEHEGMENLANNELNLPLLTSKLNNHRKIIPLLSGIHIADNLTQALDKTPFLSPYESIVTRDGVWLGPNWLRMQSTKNKQGGVLQREKELAALTQKINELTPTISNLENLIAANQQRIQRLDSEQLSLQHELDQLNHNKNSSHRDLSSKEVKLLSLQQRQTLLTTEIATQENVLSNLSQELNAITEEISANRELANEKSSAKEKLEEQRDEVRGALETAETKAKEEQQAFDDLKRRLELVTKEVGYIQQNAERSERGLAALTERRNQVASSLKELTEPEEPLNNELEQYLEQRLNLERELGEAKQKLDGLNSQIRDLEQQRNITQEQVQQVRASLEQVRIMVEGIKVKRETFSDQISEAGLELEELVAELFPQQPEDEQETPTKEPPNLEKLQQKLGRVLSRIENLGPINLTAIDEYTKQQERKEYLDSQNDDLISALNTLQNAIYKIDHETKVKFKDTFENVNQIFVKLFPKIFGGGKAALRLTEDDLLTTGVEIFAQPPGKRNTSIHLLSGGEKTLTAIALIFSMFQLNPAPFCILDEVDAPLDDENVNRFCNLVKEMAEDVQFIYITHNKITMEIADQLLGITMQEPGVSRVVAVDLKQALEMAD